MRGAPYAMCVVAACRRKATRCAQPRSRAFRRSIEEREARCHMRRRQRSFDVRAARRKRFSFSPCGVRGAVRRARAARARARVYYGDVFDRCARKMRAAKAKISISHFLRAMRKDVYALRARSSFPAERRARRQKRFQRFCEYRNDMITMMRRADYERRDEEDGGRQVCRGELLSVCPTTVRPGSSSSPLSPPLTAPCLPPGSPSGGGAKQSAAVRCAKK